ncbi:MAG: hypothetical protein IIB12_03230 [Chloroflexi bacterium]|nr:hypothetical protein [Chloroflexota bacterium]
MKIQQLPRDRMRRHAARWHDTKMSGRTYCLTPGQALPGNVSLPDALGKLIGDCQTGAFLFWSAAQAHLVVPPFPVSRSAEYDGWHAGPLQSLLDRPRTIAVLLLRLGGMAAGVFEGERLIASKVGTRFVKMASNWLDPAERRWTQPYHITESTKAKDDNGIPASIKGGPANWVPSDRELAAATAGADRGLSSLKIEEWRQANTNANGRI